MITSSPKESVLNFYKNKYGNAPGRVNLIGEHTDYNEGYVMPLAINYAVWIAFSQIPKPGAHLHSINFDQNVIISINKELTKGEGWSEYLKGLINIYKNSKFKIFGWKVIIAGNVPIGAGLSSSAVLTLALTRVFTKVSY